MNKEKQLLKNTTIVTIGKIATQMITFFLLPLYTAVLSKEEYGVVDLLNTLVGLLLPIVTLQIEQGMFRYLIDYRDNKEKETEIITTVTRFLGIQLLMYCIGFICIAPLIHNIYKYFLFANLIIGIFSSVVLQVARGLGDNKNYAIGSFIMGVVTVIFNVILVAGVRMGASGMLVASFLGNLSCVVYICFIKKIKHYIQKKSYNKKLLKEIVSYSIPLIPNIISWWIVDASDRSIIAMVLGIGQNGIYSAANKFSNVFSMLYSVFNITWTESAAININSPERDKFFSKIFDITIRIFGSIAIMIIACMPFIFPIMINKNYGEAYFQIPILMVGSVFYVLVSFLGSIYVAKKISKEIAKTSIIAAVINITINIGLIKFIGLYAASASTCIAYMIMFVYRFFDSKKYVKLKVDGRMVVSMIVAMICTLYIYYFGNIVVKGINILIIVIYILCINKKSIKFIINEGLKKIKKC